MDNRGWGMNLIEALDIQEILVTENQFEAKMKLGSFHAQPYGYLNGGATIAFAEIIAGYASNQLGKGSYHAVGQTVTANHVKSKRAEGYLYAKAELLHKGNRNHLWNIKMLNEEGDLIAIITVLNAIICMPT